MKAVTSDALNGLFKEAERSSRKRINLNLHRDGDDINVFFNAFLPGTYPQPHRHKDKDEYFTIISGAALVLEFSNDGTIQDAVLLEPQCAVACKIPVGSWHTVLALIPSILLEAKAGPYDPATAKECAPWAPAENNTAAKDYTQRIIQKIHRAHPEMLLFRFLQE